MTVEYGAEGKWQSLSFMVMIYHWYLVRGGSALPAERSCKSRSRELLHRRSTGPLARPTRGSILHCSRDPRGLLAWIVLLPLLCWNSPALMTICTVLPGMKLHIASKRCCQMIFGCLAIAQKIQLFLEKKFFFNSMNNFFNFYNKKIIIKKN